jgi:hypothetical protein
VSKRTRLYRSSKRVKVAAAKRVKVAAAKRTPQVHTLRKRTSEQEAQKQDSGTAIKQLPCQRCHRIFGSAQGLASHLTDSYRCPSSSNYHPPTAEPAKRVLQRAEASTALHQISVLASSVTNEPQTDLPALRRLHIVYAHSISIGMHKEKYFLLMTLDGIDFTYCSATADRTEPGSLIHEFMTLTRLKIDCIRYDGAAEFAKRQCCTFAAYMLTGKTSKAKVMREIRCSRAACALPRRGTRLALVWVLRHRAPASHASPGGE